MQLLFGFLGGLLIGLSAGLLLLGAGEILGASGIVSTTLGIAWPPLPFLWTPKEHWKAVLLASFCLTSKLFFAPLYQDYEQGLASLSPWAFMIGGLLVGFGTKLGNGCTSGHGICGLARFSKRSLVSVCTFMAFGIATAVLTQPGNLTGDNAFTFLRNEEPSSNPPFAEWSAKLATIVVFFLVLMALIAPYLHAMSGQKTTTRLYSKLGPAVAAGILFSCGLYVSRMVYPKVVLGFLNVALIPQGEWDATLMFVMGGGLIVSIASYQMVQGYTFEFILRRLPASMPPLSHPLYLSTKDQEDASLDFSIPTNQVIDRDLVLGAAMFGIGWGTAGLCPGPAMLLASIGVSWVLVCYWPAFFLGAYLATLVKGRQCTCWCSQRQPDDLNHDNKESQKSHTGDSEADSMTDGGPSPGYESMAANKTNVGE